MEDSIAQMKQILKSERGILAREAQLMSFFVRLFCQLLALALEELDLEMIQPKLCEGYRIEKKSSRKLSFAFGCVAYRRRRLIKEGHPAVYPLDEFLKLVPRQQFSCGAEALLAEASTQGVYRKTAETIGIVSPLSVSHQKLREIAVKVGKGIDAAQSADLSEESSEDLNRQVKVLYIEGDAFCVKAQGGGLLYLHRVQVCEGRRKKSKKRRELIGFHDFIDLDRKKVYGQLLEYLSRTYDMSQVILVSNSDNGSGYGYSDFHDLVTQKGQVHEHFIDRYHVHKKLKERLKFVPEELVSQFQELLWRYDFEALEVLYDTVESFCETREQLEDLSLLKAYLKRNWPYLKPFEKRKSLEGFDSVFGTCESHHRIYTYRMKKQGKYWSAEGASAMAKLIAAKRNGELWKYGAGFVLPDIRLPEVSACVIRGIKRLWQQEVDYEALHQAHLVVPQLRTVFAR